MANILNKILEKIRKPQAPENLTDLAKRMSPKFNALNAKTSEGLSDKALSERKKGAKTLENAAQGKKVTIKDLNHAAGQLDIMEKKVPQLDISEDIKLDASLLREAANNITEFKIPPDENSTEHHFQRPKSKTQDNDLWAGLTGGRDPDDKPHSELKPSANNDKNVLETAKEVQQRINISKLKNALEAEDTQQAANFATRDVTEKIETAKEAQQRIKIAKLIDTLKAEDSKNNAEKTTKLSGKELETPEEALITSQERTMTANAKNAQIAQENYETAKDLTRQHETPEEKLQNKWAKNAQESTTSKISAEVIRREIAQKAEVAKGNAQGGGGSFQAQQQARRESSAANKAAGQKNPSAHR